MLRTVTSHFLMNFTLVNDPNTTTRSFTLAASCMTTFCTCLSSTASEVIVETTNNHCTKRDTCDKSHKEFIKGIWKTELICSYGKCALKRIRDWISRVIIAFQAWSSSSSSSNSHWLLLPSFNPKPPTSLPHRPFICTVNETTLMDTCIP